MDWYFGVKLWKRVFAGLALGIAFGLAATSTMGVEASEPLLGQIKIIGDIFVAMIRLVIIPLIFMTLVAGVLALGEPSKLGTIGLKTILLYLATTFFANVIGLIMGTVFQPGRGVDGLGQAEARAVSTESASMLERIIGMATKNPFEKFLNGDLMLFGLTAALIVIAIVVTRRRESLGDFNPGLGNLFIVLFAIGLAAGSADVIFVIFLSILLGVGVLFTGAAGQPVTRFFSYASDKVLGVTQWIMELAPFGVFALVAYVAGTSGIETFTAIFWLAVAVYLGCFVHMAVTYGSIIKFVLGLPFINFFRGILDAQMVAYSTASSSATLPVTISNVRNNLGVSKSVAGSVLPLGATINMDGTGLYLGIVALFAAQALGYTVEPQHYALIATTAALASIGAASIPSAGLFLLATVLQVFDVSPEHTALVIGFILPFDRVLDMIRTVVNVTGDATVAVTVAKWEGQLDEEVFRSKATQ